MSDQFSHKNYCRYEGKKNAKIESRVTNIHTQINLSVSSRVCQFNPTQILNKKKNNFQNKKFN